MSLMNIHHLVQEFYAIEATMAMLTVKQINIFEPMRHSHCRWYQDFCDFKDKFYNKLASAIYDYTVLVVAAELRHCKNKASHYIDGYYTNETSRNEVYYDCISYNDNDILMAGLRLFDTAYVKWSRNFGGENWRHIAEAGLLKGKVSDCIFIDHCVDLSHNNCNYFDKCANIFELSNIKQYRLYLDMKRYCPHPWALISVETGYVLNRLLHRASRLRVIPCFDDEILSSSDSDETESLLLSYEPVQWGDLRLVCSSHDVVERNTHALDLRCDRDRRYDMCA